jgi:membrane fusion protein, multidrug efflux system
VTSVAPEALEQSPTNPPPLAGASRTRARVGWWVLLGALSVAAIFGVWWLLAAGHESTDDAVIDAEVVAIPAKTAGTVVKVLFAENQVVKAGDTLVVLDDDQARAKLAQADANVEAAEASAQAADADTVVTQTNAIGNKSVAEATFETASVGAMTATDQIREADAALRSAEAARTQAASDRTRMKALVDEGSVSSAAFDQSDTAERLAAANLDAAKARLQELRSAAAQAKSRINEASQRVRQNRDVGAVVAQASARAHAAHAAVDLAKATRELARLDLSYTKLVAPHDGTVSKKSVAVGQMVTSGQSVVQLVLPDIWVTANFKETQIADMRVGQTATFEVDAFPGVTIKGQVESFSAATGSRFTLLPPDNASGNFTKVVQRIPVRIHVLSPPPGIVLRPGMSVDLRVNTRG